MNLIAIDIGNTTITAGLFLDDIEAGIEKTSGDKTEELAEVLTNFWQRMPFVMTAKDKTKREGVIIVASVKPEWTEKIRQIAKEKLDGKVLEIGVGKDIPLPMELDVEQPKQVGVDRVMAAYAAYSVVEEAVLIADFGTAVTVDIVDDKGVFLGGTIFPGFEISADALNRHTVALPKIGKITMPEKPFGRNTVEAINNGLYYSALGGLEMITRLYAEHLGRWPQTIVTGGNVEIIKTGCDFADTFVEDLVVKGIVLTFKKYLAEQA
jgi:type III pantothenate kinase